MLPLAKAKIDPFTSVFNFFLSLETARSSDLLVCLCVHVCGSSQMLECASLPRSLPWTLLVFLSFLSGNGICAHFNLQDSAQQLPCQIVVATDVFQKQWEFRHVFRGECRV